MSLVESLQGWKEGVQCYHQGDFNNALKKFKGMNDSSAKIMFNIGRVYMSLSELQKSSQAFQYVIKKDEHLAIGHFMLGVVNLRCSRYADALINFNETHRNLRGSKLIDYKQLGMRYKLFKCEVLLNRAVCLSNLGRTEHAVKELLVALQCKVEPRHSIIDASLNNLQKGYSIQFVAMDAVFQPPRSKTANLEKRDYLGKAQVVVDTYAYEKMESPAFLRNQFKQNHSSSSNEELYRVLYDFTAKSSTEVSVKAGDVITVTEKAGDGWFTMVTHDDAKKAGLVPGSYLEKINSDETKNSRNNNKTDRQVLLSDLRKKETRASLRRSQPPPKKPTPSLPPGAKFGKPDSSNRGRSLSDYLTGGEHIYQNDPPSRNSVPWGGNTSPKLPPRKIPRSSSSEGLLSRNNLENVLRKSPNDSPTLRKNLPELPKSTPQSVDIDSNDYEEMAEIDVTPYAVHDVVPTDGRELTNGKNGRKGPERPAPPPKGGVTLKCREPPPLTIPCVPRANTVSIHGSAFDQKQAPPMATTLPKPLRSPPRPIGKPPASPKPVRNKTNGTTKAQAKTVTVEFVVSTSLKLSPSTTLKDIQTSAKDAITKNLESSLWFEKDGKKIRLDDQEALNTLDFVKDGKLKLWCFP